jgi:hypothetical protein
MLANGRWDLTRRLNADLDGEYMPDIDTLYKQSRLQFVIFSSSLHCAHKFACLHFNAGKPNNTDNPNRHCKE